ncbi:hypothetical protein [Sphingomonas ginkgonis]|uniref:hypothetical protein n=1 Tax=Sphingomonas ginkgonis TaxID=2315330 RepID=UPI00163A0F51|nr:hypothetical protein [Sphingomonas ginkgonis]
MTVRRMARRDRAGDASPALRERAYFARKHGISWEQARMLLRERDLERLVVGQAPL